MKDFDINFTFGVQEWYTNLRAQLISAQLPLVPWSSIDQSCKIVDVNADQCNNFQHTLPIMSRALYTYFWKNKDTLFEGNHLYREELTSYETVFDGGLGFLTNIVRNNHPKVHDQSIGCKITIFLTIPVLFHDNTNVFSTFFNALCEYFDNTEQVDPYTRLQYYIQRL